MNFKEALIAHLQGQNVEVCGVATATPWKPFMLYHGNIPMHLIDDPAFGGGCEYRLAPRTILVNGVEVPAPETEAPKHEQRYFISDPTCEDGVSEFAWVNDRTDNRCLRLGIVYLDQESAMARAKAMLITQESV